jgi:tripartite-type tricarboxylate transporter receptor subunit TctC
VMLIQGGGPIRQNVKAGKLVALGVSQPARSPLYPDVPTIAEAYPGFETQSWVGMFAPTGTPKPVIDRLYAALAKSLADPGMKERFESQAAEVIGGTPQALAQVVRDDQAKWSRLIRDKKIAAD